jgi:hypothetical protein
MNGSGLPDLYAVTQLQRSVTATLSMLRRASDQSARVCTEVISRDQWPLQNGTGPDVSATSKSNIANQPR